MEVPKRRMRNRGRPRGLDYELIKEAILLHKEELMCKSGKIKSKNDEIWRQILESFPNNARVPKNGEGLYAFVVNNVDNVREELTEALGISVKRPSPDDPVSEESGSNWEESVIQEELLNFQFSLTQEEYFAIRLERTIKRNLNGNVLQLRKFVFKPFQWLTPINEKIWYASGRKCGYNNRNSYISADGNSGNFTGYCKCGSDLQCFFEMEGTQVIFKCSVTEGDGQCKLLFLRKPLRIRYAEALEHDKAHVLEAKLATHFKHPSNNNRAPMVPKPTVLRVAKSELTRSRYYDKDPVIALSIMKASDYAEDIHLVGMDPFKVFYWTPHQCQVYNRYLASTNGTLFADATGGFVPRFTKVNGEKTHAVFLYVGVINTTAGQFPVAQMVSEAHDTITITGFWLQWQQYGFALPPEVIMDSSRALVTAAILSFTKYKTIEEYADAGMTDEKIDCYVRYDVAHFIKMYSGFLKDAPRLVKVFFLGCLGKLMKMTEKHIIRSFFKDLFIVALFETNGLVKGKQLPSLCQEAKDRLLSLITDSEGEVILETENKENEVEDDGEQVLIHDYTLSATDDVINTWYEWGLEIKNEVLQLMKTTKEQKSKDNGTEINGYRFPTLVDRMVLDIRHLPLFTGVTYHKYNYGRLPGSSASVECEIKKIKNDVFQKQKYRPDVAVQRHIDYLHGRMIVMDDEMNAKERHEEPNLDPQNETNTSPEFPECDESRSQNDYPSKPDCSLSDSFDDKFTQENGYDASVDSSDDSQSLVINSHPKDNKKDDETGHNENSTEAPQVQNDFTNKMRCIACANGQIPSAHRCIRCLKPVHLLEGCSLAIDGTEEGYGEFRVCLECHSNANSEPSVINNSTEDMKCTACADGKIPFTHLCARCKRQIHDLHGCSIVIPNIQGSTVSVRVCLTCKSMSIKDLNEFLSKLCVENWRGLGRKAETKSRGLYTGGNEHKLKDILTLEKTKGLPVLKSGQSRGLKPVRIKDRKICLVHTCPFDSVFQILLAACCDYPSVRERMEEEVAHNEMYALVIDSLENSLRSWTYRLRAEILSKYFPTSRKFEGIEEIDCKDEICNFVRKIFKQMPSWIEKSKCNQGCRERTIVTEVISLPAESLSDNNFSTIFESYILTDMERKCTNVKCSGMEQTTENIIGDIVVFEPYWSDGSYVRKPLKSLPVEFIHPIDNTAMKLLGIIEFCPPRTRTTSLEGVGHYIPVCYRRDKKWIKYDDRRDKEDKVNAKYEAKISLMFYAKL